MRAVWVEHPGGLDALVDAHLPVPEPKPGEVRVRVAFAGFNPVDAAWRRGLHKPPLPGVLGRDFSGHVDAPGEGVSGFREGDRVLGYAAASSNGTYAEYVCVPQELLAHAPHDLAMALAGALPVAGLTAAMILEQDRPREGERILVTGAAGAVGTVLDHLARATKVELTAATTTEAGRAYLAKCQAVPVDRIVVLAEGRSEIAPGRFDAAYDLAGGRQKLLAFQAVRAGGRVVSIVEEPADFALPIWDERESPLVNRSLGFRFVQLGALIRHSPRAAWRWYGETLSRLASNPPDALAVEVLGSLSAATARKAHQLLEARQAAGKLVMRVA
ncbi:MAG: NADP-dependent oxidoreductase [Deltaproteobacteria bacterium]|nr:NADP-dependent oxidoreductase [Deltaproteobacteria bacterium]